MPASARPGSSSGSKSSCWPKRASTQAWNRVPNRAAGDGWRGIGRARSRRTGPGRRAAAASAVADRLEGSGTSTVVGPVRGAPPPAAGRARRPTRLDRGRASSHVVGGLRLTGGRPRRPAVARPAAAASSRRCDLGGVGSSTGQGSVRSTAASGVGRALGGPVQPRLRHARPSSSSASRDGPLVRRGTAAGSAVGPSTRSDETTSRCRGAGEGDVAEPQLLLRSCAFAAAVSASRSAGGVTRRAAAGRGRRRAAAAGSTAGHRGPPRAAAVGGELLARRRRPGRPTSHSRPLARWTVSSLTESASVGVATSRPCAVARPRPRGRPAAPAGSPSPSTAWNSATAFTNRSRLSRRAGAAGLTDDASSTSMPVVSMIRRTRSRSGSPTCARSVPQLAGEQREPLAGLGE